MIRILVVEDEVIVGLAMREEFHDLGAVVAVAHDAESALQLLAAESFDAAIIDVALPGMRGDELAAHCTRTHPLMPIVLASGLNERDVRRALPPDSPIAVIEKPYEFTALRDCLARLGIAFGLPTATSSEV